MGLQGYVGSADDQARIRRLEREREAEKQRIEDVRKASISKPVGFRQWKQGTIAATEMAFKQETVGLVSRDEYIERKATIEARLEEEEKKRKRQQETEQLENFAAARAKQAGQRKVAKLSFVEDDEEEEGIASDRLRIDVHWKKDDGVATDFLPDTERDRAMEDARHQLKQKWLADQKRLKERELHLKYCYWDGSGHVRHVKVKVGDTIQEFLSRARIQLAADFPQMRNATVMNLLFVKDDLILPHSLTFYSLIVGGAQNPKLYEALFDPDVPIGRQKPHAAKVVQRHWFESSKHHYPVSQWEPFDEDKHVTATT